MGISVKSKNTFKYKYILDMHDNNAISETVLELWPKQKLIVALKSVSGHLFIDARKWIEVNGTLTARKGLMISVEHWPKVMEKIREMLDENCNSPL